MTKKTRYFLAGSAAVLAIGLCTGLIAYFAGGFQGVAAAPVAHELQYVPADSTVVAYADVRSIMDSDLRQRLRATLPMHGEGQEEFQAHTGIDIERDIDYIVAAAYGVSESPDGLIVARGRFNDTQLEAFARQHGGTVEEYKGKRLVTSPPQHRKQITLAFLEPGLVAIGTRPTVQRAIDAQMSAHSITSNDEMMQVVSDINRSSSVVANAWAVGRFDMIASQAKLPPEVAKRMPPVKWFAASGHINGGVTGMLRVEASDEQAADLLRRQVSGALAFGEMIGQSDPKASALINSLQMSGTGKTVAVSFSVPAEMLELLPKAAGDVHPDLR